MTARAGLARSVWPVAIACVIAARSLAPASAVTFHIDPESSLAWWQVLPHLNHLWATTCPEDPSWLPGAWGHNPGTEDASPISTATNKTLDTNLVRIPLLPRYRVRAVCDRKAVHGEIDVQDTTTWRGLHGRITVDAAALTTGETLRDEYGRSAVMEASRYPKIVFTIDSVADVTPGPGDTVHAVAYGTLSLHGVDQPLAVHIAAWHDAGGIRVKGRWFIPAPDLIETYHFSKAAFGLGVGLRLWKAVWMGIDLVMRPGDVTS